MILVIDVDYKETHATIAGISFNSWLDNVASATFISELDEVEDYISGQFYKRELPCIQHLIQEHNLTPTCIVIDGFVYLDGNSKAGLGKHLYDSLAIKVPVIGVAKKAFKDMAEACEVYRGQSKKPLYVTSVGLDISEAKQFIKSMYGEYRIPYLLKQVDSLCRQN